MQLDSFKLATKKGNTLLWIYNINHIHQNVSFIYDESWNKTWPDVYIHTSTSFFFKLNLFQIEKTEVQNSELTYENKYQISSIFEKCPMLL